MGDTRLGGGASDIARLTRTALNGLYNNNTNTADCGGATEPAGRGSKAGPAPLPIVIKRTPSGAQDPDEVPLGTARESRTPPTLVRI